MRKHSVQMPYKRQDLSRGKPPAEMILLFLKETSATMNGVEYPYFDFRTYAARGRGSKPSSILELSIRVRRCSFDAKKISPRGGPYREHDNNIHGKRTKKVLTAPENGSP